MPRIVAALLLGLVLGLGAGFTAFAHGDPVLELGAERIQPGGTVEIRADFGDVEAFDVTLIANDGGRRFLGTLPATEDGHLQSFVTIPADVAAGNYLVEIASDVAVLRAALTVAGEPISREKGQLPGQDEGIGVVPASSGAGVGSIGSSAAGSSRVRAGTVDGVLVLILDAVAALGLVGVLRLVGRRRA